MSVLSLFVVVASCATPRLAGDDLPPAPRGLEDAFQRMPGAAEARLRILDDNVDAWVARWNAVASARRSIGAQYFILEPDAYSVALLGLLAEKARDGVKARLMLDARGSFTLIRDARRSLLQECARAGVDVRVYNPMLQQVSSTLARGDLRAIAASNHDKLLIVDGCVAIAGGRNFSKDHLADRGDQASAYIDMDVLDKGESAARRLTDAFASEFNAERATPLLVEAPGDGRTALALAVRAMRLWLDDVPFSADELAALDEEKRAAIATLLEGEVVRSHPTVLADEVRAILRDVTTLLARHARLRGARTPRHAPAGRRGVAGACARHPLGRRSGAEKHRQREPAVRGAGGDARHRDPEPVFRSHRTLAARAGGGRRPRRRHHPPHEQPSIVGQPPTQAAFLRQWPRLLARVPTARLFVVAEGRLMHAKVGITDDQLAFVGSYNLVPLSAAVNGRRRPVDAPAARHLGELIRRRIDKGPPAVVKYRIARDADDRAVIKDGEAVIVFGPDDRCTPEQLDAARRLEPALEVLAPLL